MVSRSLASFAGLLLVVFYALAQTPTPAAPMMLRVTGGVAPPPPPPPPAGLTYVSPYDDMTQRCISVNGSGSENGTLGNCWDFTTDGAAVLSGTAVNGNSFDPGVRLRWQSGNYALATVLGAGLFVHTNDGTGTDLSGRLVNTAEPGAAPYSVIFDGEESFSFGGGMDYWVWDGEEAPLDFVNGPTAYFTLSANLGQGNNRAAFLVMRNFRGAVTQDDPTGQGNAGFVRDLGSPEMTFENFDIELASADTNDNVACLLMDRMVSVRIRNGECNVTGSDNQGRAFYLKHVASPQTSPSQWDWRVERSWFHGDQMSMGPDYGIFRDMVYSGGSWIEQNGGDTGNNFNRFAHISADGFNFQDYQINSDPFPGAHGIRIENSLIGSWLLEDGTEAPTILATGFTGDLSYGGVNYNLAGIQGTLGTGEGSTQTATLFVGSNGDTLSDWAVHPSGPVGMTPTGRNPGADISKVGVVSAAMNKPTVYEDYYGTPYSARSDSGWYGDTATIDTGAHIRSGLNNAPAFGAARLQWTMGNGGVPNNWGNAQRHLFDQSDDLTLEFEIWTGASFYGDFHLIYVLSTEEGAFAGPADNGSNFAAYFEPDQPSVGTGNPGYMWFQVRRNNLTSDNPGNRWSSYSCDDVGNLVEIETCIDVMDGERHFVRYVLQGNTIGQNDGILEVWVDGQLTIAATDVEYFSEAGQQFNQLLVGPDFNAGTAAITEEAFFADLRMYNRDW